MAVKILLAEDDDQLRSLLNLILESAGFSLLIAKDAQEAIQLANGAGAIDLLISNVQMPGMAGTDLAKHLRRSRPDLRVLMISGYPQGMLDHGCHFLKKPFLPDEIIAKVLEILRSPTSKETDRDSRNVA